MFSDYLLSFSILISTQVVTTFLEGASVLGPHLPSLTTLPNQHYVMPKTSLLQSPRFFRKPISSSSQNDDRHLSSMILNGYDKIKSSHQTGPLQYLSEKVFPSSDDYLKKSFETNKQKTLRQTVRENIREIDGSCLKLLAKRTTGNGGRNCVKMETFVTDLQKYIADMRSNSLTARNLFLESQALFYHQLVDTSGVTDNMAVSLIYHLNEMITNVKSFNVDPRFLDGAEVTKVIGTEGRSITHWNSEGHWKTLVEYQDGKCSFINKELNENQQNNLLRFLDPNFPQGPNGMSNGYAHYRKEDELQNTKACYNLDKECDENSDIFKFRNTHRVDPTMQISIKFFDDGSTAAVFRIFSTSSEAATYTSEFNAQRKQSPLIEGGERTDKNGIVRDLRVGKYNSSIDEYYLSTIHLMTNEEREIKYEVRDTEKQSFKGSEFPYKFLDKNIFFKQKGEFSDLPVVSRANPKAPIIDPITSDSNMDNRVNNGQSDSALSNVQQNEKSLEGFSKFDTSFYHGLVSSQIAPEISKSIIRYKNEFVNDVMRFNVSKSIGITISRVFGANGQILTYVSSKGSLEKLIEFQNDKFSVKNATLRDKFRTQCENLIKFLDHFVPGNINGKPYENLQQDLAKFKDEYQDELKNSKNLTDEFDLIPILMFQNAFEIFPATRVSLQYVGNGKLNISFELYGNIFKAPTPIDLNLNDKETIKTAPPSSATDETFKAAKVKEFFDEPPIFKGTEVRDQNGNIERIAYAFIDPNTRLSGLTQAALFYLGYEYVAPIFEGKEPSDQHSSETVEEEESSNVHEHHRKYTSNIYDEPDHNIHESILERLHDIQTGHITSGHAIENLVEDIVHGANQDFHDVIEYCKDHLPIHNGENIQHHGVMENSHPIHELGFHPGQCIARVVVGKLWDKIRQCRIRDQLFIGSACLMMSPFIPNYMAAYVIRTVCYRECSRGVMKILPDQLRCIQCLIPYLDILLGDPSHVVAGLSTVLLSQKFSLEVAKFLDHPFLNQWLSSKLKNSPTQSEKHDAEDLKSKNEQNTLKMFPKSDSNSLESNSNDEVSETISNNVESNSIGQVSDSESINIESNPNVHLSSTSSNRNRTSLARPVFDRYNTSYVTPTGDDFLRRRRPWNTIDAYYVTPTGELRDYYNFSGEPRPSSRRYTILPPLNPLPPFIMRNPIWRFPSRS